MRFGKARGLRISIRIEERFIWALVALALILSRVFRRFNKPEVVSRHLGFMLSELLRGGGVKGSCGETGVRVSRADRRRCG